MPGDESLNGRLAPLPTVSGVCISAEHRRSAGRNLELLLWLGPEHAGPYLKAGEFWTEWHFGAPCWVRFKHELTVFNRAAFAAVEVRPAHGPELPPPGALWLLSAPPSLQPKATA